MCWPAGTQLLAGSAWASYETTLDEQRARQDRCSAAMARQTATHASGSVGGVQQCCANVPSDCCHGLVPYVAYQGLVPYIAYQGLVPYIMA
jgi:hypothetical protein